jgi:GNAT superfamily N-acetyltransferase
MQGIHLRPVSPQGDFAEIARLITSQEDDPTTEKDLRKDYEAHRESLVRLMATEDGRGHFMGFSWAWRNKVEPGWVTFYLVVKPERQREGAGRQLYEDLLRAAEVAHAGKLRTSVLDSSPEARLFLERRGFNQIRHQIGMQLDLAAFDDRPWEAVLERLKDESFRFTSMQELGDTEEAQHKLYALNDAASASTPGQGGEHAWASFEDFQQSVCRADWYRPDGQIVAIDTVTGAWAGMSAITRKVPGTGMNGQDYAYNLFTGVDLPYRGRRLGQAVKLLALRYAREVLKVNIVRTHHNTKNLPMIAIDTKFGYHLFSGAYLMEKILQM